MAIGHWHGFATSGKSSAMSDSRAPRRAPGTGCCGCPKRTPTTLERFKFSRLDAPPHVPRLQDRRGLDRPLGPGWVCRRPLRRGRPGGNDRVADGPLRLYLVATDEERLVASQDVEEQPLVGLRRLGQERHPV